MCDIYANLFSHFLGGLSLHLNHLIGSASENLFSLIWDTSHWNSILKFGLRTAYDMS